MKRLLNFSLIFLSISILVLVYYFQYYKLPKIETEKYQLMIEKEQYEKIIKFDERTILFKSQEIKTLEAINSKLTDKIKAIQKKYNSVLKNYITIKAQMDSIIKIQADVVQDSVEKDKFLFDKYFDLFEIYGYYTCNNPFIEVNLAQVKPTILNIGIYKTKNDTPFVMINSNSSLLQFDKANVKFYNYDFRKSFWDRLKISSGVSIANLGFSFGFYYNNFGILYMNYLNRNYDVMVTYQTSLRDLWRKVKQ